jgi:protein-disulfide isomerase
LPLLEQVLENNPDTVKVVFKNFPITSIHDYADLAARAALAAFNQGKFWEYHDALFAADTLSDQVIADTAVKVGLDISQFRKDLDSEAIRAKLAQDIADGEKIGVRGTPSIFVNGNKLKNRSPQAFQALIDQELKRAAQ